MNIFEDFKILQEASHNKLVKTERVLPIEMQEIYGDIKSLLLQIHAELKKSDVQTNSYFEGLDTITVTQEENSIMLAGGSLSELFIEGYEEKPKDIDIFVNTQFLGYKFNNWLSKNKLCGILNETIGSFKMREEIELIRSAYSVSSKVTNIATGYHKNHPNLPIEIIFIQEGGMKFDLAIREFYCLGDAIFATERAMRDIENKTVSISVMNSPISTMVRMKAFAERYGYKEDEFTKSWALKYVKFLFDEPKEIQEIFDKVSKYRETFDIEKLITDVESLKLSEEEKEIMVEINNWEEYYLKSFFREAVERMNIAEKKGINLNKTYNIKVKKLKPQMSAVRKSNNVLSVEDHLEIIEIEKEMEEGYRVKMMFSHGYEREEIEEKYYEDFFARLEREGYMNSYVENTIIEYKMLTMDRIISGITEKIGIDSFQKKQIDLNFGRNEHLEKYLKSEEINVRFDIHTMLKTINENDTLHFVINYGEWDKEEKKIWYAMNSSEFKIKNDCFAFLANDRFESVVEFVQKSIKDAQLDFHPNFNYQPLMLLKMGIGNYRKRNILTDEIRKKIIV